MASLIDLSNNRANMAYVGDTPWHGLGSIPANPADLDSWRIAAGATHDVIKTAEFYRHNDEYVQSDDFILIRSDNGAKLGNCSSRYQIVQPSTVIEFYRDLVADHGFTIETIGLLDGGKRIWALARTGDGFSIMGQDKVDSYLLLATSYDGTMATRAMFTEVRVVCHNTLTLANSRAKNAISIPHSTNFDHHAVKIDLGIYQGQRKAFEEECNKLASVTVGKQQALDFIFNLLKDKEQTIEDCSTRKANIIGNIYNLYCGNGKGSNFRAANGTLWGAVNAVTEYVDWQQGNNSNNRFKSAHFGQGAILKEKAFNSAIELARVA